MNRWQTALLILPAIAGIVYLILVLVTGSFTPDVVEIAREAWHLLRWLI